MNSRESEFPATSIGRSAGARFQQAAAAHESHPLLSPPPSSVASSDQSSLAGNSNGSTPKYVPYTPRHRPVPTAATTGTTVHPPPSPQPHQGGDATSKLQLMHLKAAAQNIGLDSGTLGWSILEKIVQENDATEDWAEIWTALTLSKATLLLPLESSIANEKITPDLVKDHIVLCDGPSRDSAPIVTLSGLRGVLNGESLTFRSTLHPISKRFQDVMNPQTRPSALTALPLLPTPLPNPNGPATYPTYTIPSYSSSLNLPPRPQPLAKPPLPPRPGGRPIGSGTATSSRLTNTFASLFGGNAAKAAASAPISSSPTASLHSIDSATQDTTPIEVSAFTIDRRIVHKQLAKEINKTLKSEITAALSSAPSLGNVPSWVAERVLDATAQWFPFVRPPVGIAPAPATRRKLNASSISEGKDLNGSNNYLMNSLEEAPEDASERLQDFYAFLEQDMRVGGTPFVPKTRKKKSDTTSSSELEDEKDTEKRLSEKMESEVRVRDVMEAVERTIASVFYDRLFIPPSSDDVSHDDALSSRIDALNNLDLGLRHLGIGVPSSIGEGDLNAVVEACGDMLSQLNTCHAPGDKASILVAAHKIVVDGLSRLPPIRLISEDEPQERTPYEEPETARPFPKRTPSPEVEEADTPPPPTTSQGAPTQVPLPDNVASSPTSPSPAAPIQSGLSRTKTAPSPLVLQEQPSPSPQPSVLSPSGPVLEVNPSLKKPTPVSGDVLLPFIIFAVVKANPPRLVSHLLFTQRFRNQSVGGEESYCLINMMAVAEFLENVDMAALGLEDVDKVTSTADLTPIPLTRSPVTSETPLAPADSVGPSSVSSQPGLRGRVEQQVDAIADSANKVISGVVDSSFGILRSFMPNSNNNPNSNPNTRSRPVTPKSEYGQRSLGSAGVQGNGSNATSNGPLGGAPGPAPSEAGTGFGLLRKESGFSIASLAASLPIPTARSRAGSTYEESGQQLTTVSRPSSLGRSSLKIRVGGEDDESHEETDSEEDEDESVAGSRRSRSVRAGADTGDDGSGASGDEDESDDGEEDEGVVSGPGDARSIRSFESMLKKSRTKNGSSKGRKLKKTDDANRKSLTDRLASTVTGRNKSKASPPGSRRPSLLALNAGGTSPSSSRPVSPVAIRLPPPRRRFMECTVDDLRISEVSELLREYRRLVEGVKALGGFDD